MSWYTIDTWPGGPGEAQHLAQLHAVLNDNTFPWELCIPSLQAHGAYPFPIHWATWDQSGIGGARVRSNHMILRIRPSTDALQMHAFAAIIAHELAHIADCHWLGAGDPTIHVPPGPGWEQTTPRRRALLELAEHHDTIPEPHGWWVSDVHSDRPVEGFSVPFTRLFQQNPSWHEGVVFSHRWPDLEATRAAILDQLPTDPPPVEPPVDPPVEPPVEAPPSVVYVGAASNGQRFHIVDNRFTRITPQGFDVLRWLGIPEMGTWLVDLAVDPVAGWARVVDR